MRYGIMCRSAETQSISADSKITDVCHSLRTLRSWHHFVYAVLSGGTENFQNAVTGLFRDQRATIDEQSITAHWRSNRGGTVKALDVALICSGSPRFLRSLGTLLAGRCRLMECYSIPEATQMIQLHGPDYAIFDVCAGSPQQLARTFATISNIKTGQAVLISVPGQLDETQIPQEVFTFCRIIELSNHDENYYELVEEILSPATDSNKNAKNWRRQRLIGSMQLT
jgi:hypothetical protein